MSEPSDKVMAFIRAYDTWALSPDMALGELFDEVVMARQELEDEIPFPCGDDD